ncbi:MAG TPA: glycosyltransferase family 4 protein [Candidatus Angelobacter sp.]|nr:glycosyltransferase family 4 protein [Candidatus Angelobacter sp.]
MKIALIAPPYIAVPPKRYGGTELFISELVLGLQKRGVESIVYTNGASTIRVPRKFLYEKEDWPVRDEVEANLKGINHSAWAILDAQSEADIIHLNSAPGLALQRFSNLPFVYTVHHSYEEPLTRFYSQFPDVSYVTISDFQRETLKLRRIRTIHHGIDISKYCFHPKKELYLSFLGRIAPVKAPHLAIEIAQKSGIPLKLAGEIQPLYRDYWERIVKPHVDGKFIEYVGPVGLEEKSELVGKSLAMLFPIQWDEPFGLVMIEAMACGTPVLALSGGSVAEVVKEGVSGYIGRSVDELAQRAANLDLQPESVRAYAQECFSSERMAGDYIDLYSEILDSRAASQAEPIVA